MHGMLSQYFKPSYGFFFDGDDGGGGGGGGSGEGGDGGSGADGGAGGDSKTITQEEANRIAGAARAEGRDAAEKQLAKDLGVPLDEAKAILKAHTEKVEGEKSEAQKAREAADKERQEAADEKAAAALVVHNANVKDALRDAGVLGKDKLAKVAKLVDVEVGADEAAIEAAVKVTAKEFPELFGASSGAPDSDTGGTGGKGGKGGKDAMQAGYERGSKSSRGDDETGTYAILADA